MRFQEYERKFLKDEIYDKIAEEWNASKPYKITSQGRIKWTCIGVEIVSLRRPHHDRWGLYLITTKLKRVFLSAKSKAALSNIYITLYI